MGVALETFEPRPKTCEPLDASAAAVRAAALTNEWIRAAHEVLGPHPVNAAREGRSRPPANLVLLRDAGDHLPRLESLKQRFGMNFACFAEMPVEIGIARVTGMEPILIENPGVDPAAYAALGERTLEALDGFDALYVHLKGPDIPAHDGRAADKRDVIAAIDAGYMEVVLPAVGRSVVLAVTADHSTSCVRKAHTADPVPLVVAGGGIQPDGCDAYDEVSASQGALGRLLGPQVLPMLVDITRS
jgi:2,3-bisphosphoglycerate-independent phosphoglycerate mutase